MGILRAALLLACMVAPSLAASQQGPAAKSPGAGAVGTLRQPEQQSQGSAGQSSAQVAPKFGYLRCRADAQKWTVDPFDEKDPRNAAGGGAVMVSGQFREMPYLTPHVTVVELMKRRYEMAVCATEDADFERQFGTYSYISESYDEEILFRYDAFLTRHHLRHEFFQEDAAANK